jgi:hypothetical protein
MSSSLRIFQNILLGYQADSFQEFSDGVRRKIPRGKTTQAISGGVAVKSSM